MIIFGKQTEGPISYIPNGFVWAGCIWLFFINRSAIITIPKVILDFLVMVGVDPYDG